MVIELVETIDKGIHLSIQRIVYPGRSTEKFGLIDRRAVSQRLLRNLWSDSRQIWNADARQLSAKSSL